MVGRRLNHYRIIEKIGAGGMGTVYRARDERLDRDVAIKVVNPGRVPNASIRDRLKREARALSKVNCPYIATLYDWDCQEGVDFLVMELVNGGTLADRLTKGLMDPEAVLAVGAQILEALEEAHQHGVIHRDLKPANIALDSKGRVKVLDFGLARLRATTDESITEALSDAQQIVGTLAYMAPEQLKGESADERADIYAAGAGAV